MVEPQEAAQEAPRSTLHASTLYPPAPLYSQFQHEARLHGLEATTCYQAAQGLAAIAQLLDFDREAQDDCANNEAGGQPLDPNLRAGLLCAMAILSGAVLDIFTSAHQRDRQQVQMAKAY